MGFNAKCLFAIHGIRYGDVIYARIGVWCHNRYRPTAYSILNRETGRTLLTISASMFNLCFEVV
jgi:hypothetical protein